MVQIKTIRLAKKYVYAVYRRCIQNMIQIVGNMKKENIHYAK